MSLMELVCFRFEKMLIFMSFVFLKKTHPSIKNRRNGKIVGEMGFSVGSELLAQANDL